MIAKRDARSTACDHGAVRRKESFSRSSRLTERTEFLRLFDNPKVYRAAAFQAFWKPNGTQGPRLGITIKGRLGSVWRMRLKRAVREWFRCAKDSLGKSDVNIVIRVPVKLDREYLDALKRQLADWKN